MENKAINTQRDAKNGGLKLIPKAENYIYYILNNILLHLPRIEKFNIGNEYKTSMYQMLRDIMYIDKIEAKDRLNIINKVDAELNTQRIYLRIMYNQKFIDKKKFDNAMELIYEMGKMIGGLVKYYGKNNKKPIW